MARMQADFNQNLGLKSGPWHKPIRDWADAVSLALYVVRQLAYAVRQESAARRR